MIRRPFVFISFPKVQTPDLCDPCFFWIASPSARHDLGEGAQ